ncbi:MAG: type II toxin-antitoxin system prevent-host-death family antitoxin [Methyloglobulus sp.]|jgi:prevent-host-death family protein|nr:type II toxin-antitoxin system prevent-host-death family antitoxin [Methyloglobulus sp.]
MRTMTSVEAQNRFGELLDAAQREPITITRRGRTVAFVISKQEFEALSQGLETTNSEALQAAAREAIASFRGKGESGAVERLLTDRQSDRDKEA